MSIKTWPTQCCFEPLRCGFYTLTMKSTWNDGSVRHVSETPHVPTALRTTQTDQTHISHGWIQMETAVDHLCSHLKAAERWVLVKISVQIQVDGGTKFERHSLLEFLREMSWEQDGRMNNNLKYPVWRNKSRFHEEEERHLFQASLHLLDKCFVWLINYSASLFQHYTCLNWKG